MLLLTSSCFRFLTAGTCFDFLSGFPYHSCESWGGILSVSCVHVGKNVDVDKNLRNGTHYMFRALVVNPRETFTDVTAPVAGP